MKKASKKRIGIAGILILIFILSFQGYFVFEINQNQELLKDSLEGLNKKVDIQNKEMASEIGKLRQETSLAVNSLSNELSDLKVQSNESQKAISDLTKSLTELENVRIEAGKDFSSIVEDVIDSVVSVASGNSLGSGVFVDSNHLITNYHVVEEGENMIITTYNGKKYPAHIIGYEPNVDLAVLEVNGSFPYLEFEDMNQVKIGEGVIALGSPLGLSFSVTQGIVSSKQRTGPNGLNIYLQTDTPINPGNSGGPLVNLDKKIVGINTWKIADVEGLGFSIRSDVVQEVYEEILSRFG